jgi:hypothetical protein
MGYSRGLLVLWLSAGIALAGVQSRPHDAVWSPDMDTIAQAKSEASQSGDPAAALLSTMRAKGARAEAIAFTQALAPAAGFLLKLSSRGSVSLGTIFYPFRRDNTLEPVILTPGGQLVWPARPDPARFAHDPKMQDASRRRPALYFGPCPDAASEVRTTSEGSVEIRFEYPLKDSPDGPDSGSATIAYHFRSDGTFNKADLVFLSIDQ